MFETLGLYYMMTHYQWSSLRAGLTVTVCGTLGVVSLLSFGTLLKMASDMDLVLYGMLTMLLASFMLVSLRSPVRLEYSWMNCSLFPFPYTTGPAYAACMGVLRGDCDGVFLGVSYRPHRAVRTILEDHEIR